jgi:YHS domain-containing protein
MKTHTIKQDAVAMSIQQESLPNQNGFIRKRIVIVVLLVFTVVSLALAQAPKTMSMGQTVQPDGKLTKVEDRNKICMGTNTAFAKDQIPVEIEGRTYYACCNMCKTMLAKDGTQRAAIDPVSRNSVDESLAVIGVSSNGPVVYFENERDLDTYNAAH